MKNNNFIFYNSCRKNEQIKQKMGCKKVVKQVKRHIKKAAKDKKRVKNVAKSIKIFKFLAKKQKRLLKKRRK